MSPQLQWLQELAADIAELPVESAPSPYWSQKQGRTVDREVSSLPSVVRRARQAIKSLEAEHWFAMTLGLECVDGHGEDDTTITIEEELDRRIGKPQLVTLADDDWSEDDLCDFIEVYHDLSARPTRGWIHSYGGCGFHPSRYSRSSGQRIYRWRLNELLDASGLGLRLAEQGEDTGHITRVLPDGLDDLASTLAQDLAEREPEVPHAIALFRRHDASREDRRMAVVGLAHVLEIRRELLNLDPPIRAG